MSTKVLGDLPAGASGEDIERNLQDITRAINGNDTNGIAFNLTQHDSASTYALSVTNIETGNSKTVSISTAGDTEHIIVDKSGLNFKGVAAFTGNTTITGTLDVTSDFRVATNKFTVTAATGATAVAGDFSVGSTKFTVAAATGNTVIQGTAAVTGNFSVNTSKLAVDAATGNLTINTNKVSIDGATGAQTNAGPFTAALGTITTDQNCIAATATWNSGGTTFSGAIKVVVTDTASAAASKLMALFVGASEKFSVGKAGTTDIADVLRVRADATPPPTGAGLELQYNVAGGYGSIVPYDRDGAVYKDLRIAGANIAIGTNTGAAIGFYGTATTTQQTVAAAATGAADVITLANSLRTLGINLGLWKA